MRPRGRKDLGTHDQQIAHRVAHVHAPIVGKAFEPRRAHGHAIPHVLVAVQHVGRWLRAYRTHKLPERVGLQRAPLTQKHHVVTLVAQLPSCVRLRLERRHKRVRRVWDNDAHEWVIVTRSVTLTTKLGIRSSPQRKPRRIARICLGTGSKTPSALKHARRSRRIHARKAAMARKGRHDVERAHPLWKRTRERHEPYGQRPILRVGNDLVFHDDGRSGNPLRKPIVDGKGRLTLGRAGRKLRDDAPDDHAIVRWPDIMHPSPRPTRIRTLPEPPEQRRDLGPRHAQEPRGDLRAQPSARIYGRHLPRRLHGQQGARHRNVTDASTHVELQRALHRPQRDVAKTLAPAASGNLDAAVPNLLHDGSLTRSTRRAAPLVKHPNLGNEERAIRPWRKMGIPVRIPLAHVLGPALHHDAERMGGVRPLDGRFVRAARY